MERTTQGYEIGPSKIVLRIGDITTAKTDVIVASDDADLSMAGGVSEAIRNAAGADYFASAAPHRGQKMVGDAAVTGSGELSKNGIKHVFHAITIPSRGDAPVDDTATVVRSATQRCLAIVRSMGLSSIAFPALGTGFAGFNPEDAAIAMAEIIRADLDSDETALRVEIWVYTRGVKSDLGAMRFFQRFTESANIVEKAVRNHAVLLVHGIRTQAEWQGPIASELKLADPAVNPIPIGYGYFDVVRFLVPLSMFRRLAAAKLRRRLDALSGDPAVDRISIIAHSFGTYLTGELLKADPELRLHRLILCGAVLGADFDWTNHRDQLEGIEDPDHPTVRVVNECGWRDVWPVFAETITWGYGASGRFGFKHPWVFDRYHDRKHSEFFVSGFAKNFWSPVLGANHIEPAVGERPRQPWLLSVITAFHVKYIVLIALVLIVAMIWIS